MNFFFALTLGIFLLFCSNSYADQYIKDVWACHGKAQPNLDLISSIESATEVMTAKTLVQCMELAQITDQENKTKPVAYNLQLSIPFTFGFLGDEVSELEIYTYVRNIPNSFAGEYFIDTHYSQYYENGKLKLYTTSRSNSAFTLYLTLEISDISMAEVIKKNLKEFVLKITELEEK